MMPLCFQIQRAPSRCFDFVAEDHAADSTYDRLVFEPRRYRFQGMTLWSLHQTCGPKATYDEREAAVMLMREALA